jgi:hypothetical protein
VRQDAGSHGGKKPGGKPDSKRVTVLRIPRFPPICNPFSKEGTEMVWVNAYTRIRFGRLEYVCAHARSR